MRDRVLNYMEKNGSITTREAFNHLGCTRLSEYIRQLRLTHDIADEWVEGQNRFGEKTRFKKFYVKKN